jgi:hypothetical protein
VGVAVAGVGQYDPSGQFVQVTTPSEIISMQPRFLLYS